MDDEPDDAEDSVRQAVERSRSGAPAVGRVVRDRFSTDEIFQRIVAAADEEITAGSRELFFSGLAAGFAISITFLLYVSLTAATDHDPILSTLLYPLGFIYIIIGGYQLYTENTLPPVALTLERLASVPALLRNWVVVLAGNFAGGTAGAAALAWGGVLPPEATTAAVDIAQKGIQTGSGALFAKAAFAGLIVAGVVWVEYAARDTISRIVVVYLAFLAIPLGGLFHVVVSYTELAYLVFTGNVSVVVGLVEFVVPVLLGNTVGGVVLVTVVNYFQTSERRLESARFDGAKRVLSLREWLFGSVAGRSYVPLVDTTVSEGDTDQFTLFVSVTNPESAVNLVTIAGVLAAERTNATVTLVQMLPQYDPNSRYADGEYRPGITDSRPALEELRAIIEAHDVECETSTVVSHRSFEELFDIARREDADQILMQREDERLWTTGRAERRSTELRGSPPCDVLVWQDRGFDPSRILLPIRNNAHADLNAEVARAMRGAFDSEVTLLHVVDSTGDIDRGERFLTNWAIDHDLEDAHRVVEDGSDVEGAIRTAMGDHTMLLIGATHHGLLSRLVTRSLHMDVVSQVDHSVLMAERPSGRGLLRRLFG
ncbi:MAG: formate/nitrite transporter family protein [Halococcoides sp.]